MLGSLEIRQSRDLRGFQRIPPEVLRALQLPGRRTSDDQQTHAGRGPPCESDWTVGRLQAIAGSRGSRRPARGSNRRKRFFDFEPRVADVAQTAPGIFLETALEQSPDAHRRLRRQGGPIGLVFEDRRDRVGDSLAAKHPPGRQHLVQHGAESPDVGSLVDRLSSCLLGAHVAGRARNHSFSCFLVAPKHLRQTEVEHLHGVARRDLDVRRFQIAVDDALLVRRLERLRDLARDHECLQNRQRTQGQTLGERGAFHEFEDEAADAVGLLQPVDRANLRMVQRRQDPRFAFEVRKPLRVCKEDVRDNLDCDISAQLRVVSAVNLAHPARADQSQDLVRTDLPADERRPGMIGQHARRDVSDRRREKPLRSLRVCEQSLHLLPQPFVRSACSCHERSPLARIVVKRRVAHGFDAPTTIEVFHRASPSSSRSNQSLASRQSRLTVSGDTWSTSAVSSTLKPPKKRNSIMRLFRTSTAANASKARSRATRSNDGSGDTASPSLIVTRWAPPPRLRYPRDRA